jgi:hypothetical protein
MRGATRAPLNPIPIYAAQRRISFVIKSLHFFEVFAHGPSLEMDYRKKRIIKRILISYSIGFSIVLIAFLITKDSLVALTFFIASLFAPLRMVFPGYSEDKSQKE